MKRTCFMAAALAAMPIAAHADCLDDLNATWTEQVEVRRHVSGAVQQNLSILRDAAQVLDRNDRDEACEEVVEAVSEILDKHRKDLVERNVILSRSEAQRRERYAAAVALGAAESPYTARDLLGVEVRNPSGEKLGEVKDLLIDVAAENRSYLLVERGGFLGLGENLVAVPAERVKVTRDTQTVLLDMSEDALEKAPKLDRHETLLDQEWRQRNRAFYDRSGQQGKAPAESAPSR